MDDNVQIFITPKPGHCAGPLLPVHIQLAVSSHSRSMTRDAHWPTAASILSHLNRFACPQGARFRACEFCIATACNCGQTRGWPLSHMSPLFPGMHTCDDGLCDDDVCHPPPLTTML